jgi:hypothetical protein
MMPEKDLEEQEQYEKPELRKEGELRDITANDVSPV